MGRCRGRVRIGLGWGSEAVALVDVLSWGDDTKVMITHAKTERVRNGGRFTFKLEVSGSPQRAEAAGPDWRGSSVPVAALSRRNKICIQMGGNTPGF